MADSDIVASGLAASEGIGSVALQWSISNPHELGLAYLDLALVEVWASASNNRAAATLAGEAASGQNTFVHTLEGGTTRYYWVRPKNAAGYYGDWHPLSGSAGVSGTAGVVDEINNGAINGSVITGSTFRTSASNPRVFIDGDRQQIEVFDSDGTRVAYVGLDPSSDTTLYAQRLDSFEPSIIGASQSGPGVRGSSQAGSGVLGISSDGGPGVEGSGVSFAFYATAGVYGPFTGSHDGLLAKENEIEIGDVVVTAEIVARHGVSDTLRRIERSTFRQDPAAVGVLAIRRPIDLWHTRFAALPGWPPLWMIAAFDHAIMNGLGEGQINVCGQGGPIRRGDLLVTSDVPGKAMRQADDVMRSCTIARADEDADLGPDQVAMIACIYTCG